MENKSSVFGIIALIVGAIGAGLGAFSVVNLQLVQGLQGLPGQDGQDGQDGIDGINGLDGINAPGYYCNSATEVQLALESIGPSSGTIIINVSIVLNAPIQINGGGNYVIQGAGATIYCGDDRTAFNITNVETCTIRDLKIDATDISTTNAALIINNKANNPVYIQNVQINGGDLGYGITVDSEKVWIQNCYLSNFETGIHLTDNSEFCYILENAIESMTENGIEVRNSKRNSLIGNRVKDTSTDSIWTVGIYLDHADSNTLSDNVIDGVNSSFAYGIMLDTSHNNTLCGNVISKVRAEDQAYGIMVSSSTGNTLTGNVIERIHAKNQTYGISVAWESYSTFSGNVIRKIVSDNKIGYGIQIYSSNYNTLSGSMIEDVDADEDAYGIQIEGSSLNTIIGNLIANVQPTGSGFGIYLTSDADENTVIGNIADYIKTDAIYDVDSWATNVQVGNIQS